MTTDEFLKNHENPKRTSKLAPFMEDILTLRRKGLSYSSILKFLRLNGVDITMATFSVYMRKHAPADLVPPAKNQPAKEGKPAVKEAGDDAPLLPSDTPPLDRTESSGPSVLNRSKKVEVNMDFLDEG